MAVTEQLFSEYITVDGSRGRCQVPIRINNINKVGTFLLFSKSKCHLKQMQKDLKASKNDQLIATAQLIAIETVGWEDDACRTIKQIALKMTEKDADKSYENSPEKQRSSDSDSDSIDSDLEIEQNIRNINDSHDVSMMELGIDHEIKRFKEFGTDNWKECKS